MKRTTIIIMICIMLLALATPAFAICAHNKVTIHRKDVRICNKACGFTGLFAKQDSWTETVTYFCTDGTREYKTRTNVDNGNCC